MSAARSHVMAHGSGRFIRAADAACRQPCLSRPPSGSSGSHSAFQSFLALRFMRRERCWVAELPPRGGRLRDLGSKQLPWLSCYKDDVCAWLLMSSLSDMCRVCASVGRS